jgi:hypothetical protein
VNERLLFHDDKVLEMNTLSKFTRFSREKARLDFSSLANLLGRVSALR